MTRKSEAASHSLPDTRDEKLPPIPDLPAELRGLLAQIPPRTLTTFGDFAEALGDLGAARWVAEELGAVRGTPGTPLPWHRVVCRTGELAAGTSDERHEQAARLQAEGCSLDVRGRVDVRERWTQFTSDAPLRKLAEWQAAASRKAPGGDDVPQPAIIAGVDLSYTSPTEAVAAYVACDAATGDVVAQETYRTTVPFPYISGYLTFRELPALVALVEQVARNGPLAPVILVDGSGRLHPRRFGIAVGLGLLTGHCTVGVAKHRLCGRPCGPATPAGDVPLGEGDEQLGYRLDGGSKRRTLYVSPGTGIDAASAVRIVRAVWGDHRLPEPLHHADALSRRVAVGSPSR